MQHVTGVQTGDYSFVRPDMTHVYRIKAYLYAELVYLSHIRFPELLFVCPFPNGFHTWQIWKENSVKI